ncbi:MAG: endonuclease/exonuclease/phosphatase family protein [Sedimentisphaerales bacterium]|nr:endonuclease/exonuclease/phosphatase family protein [Sedimentisphaerales bacterium]
MRLEKWIGVICICWMGLLIVGCQMAHSAGHKADDPNVLVMTFNIRYGSANDGDNHWQLRREALFTQIKQISPDVLGLQEALDFQIREILKAVPGYDFVGVGRDDGKKAGEYSPILYRKDRFKVADSGTFWFSNSPWVVGSMHWGNKLPRICTWARLIEKKTGKGLYAYNLHIDHQSAPSRVKSTELLSRKVAAREHAEPFVVTGDFNAAPDSPEILYLLGLSDRKTPLPMMDVLAAANPEQAKLGTSHGFRGNTDGARIDYILMAPGTVIIDAQIHNQPVEGHLTSDHYAVTARLRPF